MKQRIMVLALMAALISVLAVPGCASNEVASEQANASEDALAHILFDYDADEFTAYQIRRNGFVEIIFARDTPDDLYGEMVDKLRGHPDIPGVSAARTGPACGLF